MACPWTSARLASDERHTDETSILPHCFVTRTFVVSLSFFLDLEDQMRIQMNLAVLGTLIALLAMGCRGTSSNKGAPPSLPSKDSVNKMQPPPVPQPPPRK